MYIYHREGRICAVSDNPLVMDGEEVQAYCLGLSQKDVMQNFVVKEQRLLKKNQKLDPRQAKIAFICVWDIPCGISTYSRFLVEEMRRINPRIQIFAEEHEGIKAEPGVVRCWQRGQSPRKLIKEIRKYNPDLIFIQHEFGIFPDARKWTQLISALEEYQTHVVLHSVYEHQDKAVCEAICPNLIVHTEAAKEVLLAKGISSHIQVIPHGCVEFADTQRLWNIYRSPHTLVQFGFGFEYKGWEVALEAVRLLKERYPDVFYLMLFSESRFVREHHEQQYQKIKRQIEELELEENVAIIRGFQSDAALNHFLRTARIAVFPYVANPKHVVYGSTGAARVAMGNGTPVVVSKVPLFYDLQGVVPQAGGAQELAQEIALLFDDEKHYHRVAEQEKQFVRNNSWRVTAERYFAAAG